MLCVRASKACDQIASTPCFITSSRAKNQVFFSSPRRPYHRIGSKRGSIMCLRRFGVVRAIAIMTTYAAVQSQVRGRHLWQLTPK